MKASNSAICGCCTKDAETHQKKRLPGVIPTAKLLSTPLPFFKHFFKSYEPLLLHRTSFCARICTWYRHLHAAWMPFTSTRRACRSATPHPPSSFLLLFPFPFTPPPPHPLLYFLPSSIICIISISIIRLNVCTTKISLQI